MTTGDTSDMQQRVLSLLPPWFPDVAPVLNGVVAAIAGALAWGYSVIAYARAQTRVATAFGAWLDLIAWDYFGARFLRRQGEADASFRPRILDEILRPRQTRFAIGEALEDLTGIPPALFEPWNPQDCGAYGIGRIGYGVAGCYGSLSFPFQVFVTAYRPLGLGIPDVGGYGEGLIGYGVTGEYADLSLIEGPVTDAVIYQTVADTVAAGITAWVAIADYVGPVPIEFPYPLTEDETLLTMDDTDETVDHT